MKTLGSAFDRLARGEAQISRHINITGHLDDDTLIDKSGKLIKIIKLAGIDFVTRSKVALDVYKNRRNTFLKSFTASYALYFWTIRSKVTKYPEGEFAQPFAKQVNEKYRSKIEKTEMYYNALYLAIVSKQPEGIIGKGLDVFRQLSHRVDREAKENYLEQKHKELNEITRKTLSILADYQPEILSVYEKESVKFSQPLQFIGQLINYDAHAIPCVMQDAATLLPRKRLFFNRRSGTVEIRGGDNSARFAAILSIKGYPPITYQGILDSLSTLRIEYVITQSFRPYDKHDAKTKLRGQQQDLTQAKDESTSQTAQINTAVDDTASGEVGYGEHHFSLTCFANSQQELNRNVGTIIAKFSDVDIECVREDVISECCYWAQLPANFSYIARSADISTKNLAAFASLHNYTIGRLNGNHWGNAVTVLETLSGSPYYFNFHYKDVGNFLVFGTMGSGKTVLVGFLLLQSMKFGGKRIIFDKDRGLEILVRAMGGTYEIIKQGLPTGFNPCQLDDTPENRKFLAALLRKILTTNGQPLDEKDTYTIESAINGMWRLDKKERQFCHLASFFGSKHTEPLRGKFDQWHSEGAYAWLFDNPTDSFSLNTDVVGFELGDILKDPECKTPALMYLTYRVSKALEGQRGIMFFDEGWKALSDEYFRDVLNDWSRTPRKKNNFLGLATQAAEDTVTSAVSKTLNEAAVCKIFFPNPTADAKVYMEDFGLSEQEYNLIKTLPDDAHYFLLNYGRGKEMVVVRANLEGLEDEIAVISGRESTVALLDKIRARVGNDPAVWLPIFHEERKKPT